ncbi:hypothetical protein DKG77_11860 [Flagellimonas aquimarina]|uniref:Lipocalin-like domain-containing protein n=1 Tax=Flagellimonas aquimarina TaxID=2201895 RepID=A0A316KZB1_9FLAO|nr:hypothetical protein [Allomuricauda koreensis]PWL38921.1 hypothetical protein DKG77_11860 [Allomuricauda koreensis]
MANSKFFKSKFTLIICALLITSCTSSDDGGDDENETTVATVTGFYTGSIGITINGDNITVPMSLIVNMASTNKFEGDFFETGSFTPCCSSNAQDGTFNFDYNPQTMSLTNFIIWVDFNIDPENPCTGTYTGSGTLDTSGNANRMVVQMNVDDCNVSNTPAVFTLTKVSEL